MRNESNTDRPDGNKIRRLRKKANLTQEELAEKAGFQTRTIQRLEQGEPTHPSTLKCVAEALGMCREALLCEEEAPLPPDPIARYLCSFDSFIQDRRRRFVGREFVFSRVTQFLDNPDHQSGYLVIQADPGIGKSAFIAELIDRWHLHVYHFNIAPQRINSPRQFIGNTCARLVRQFQLPYSDFPADFDKDGVFLGKLLQEASDQLGEGEQIVIAVDALDEVECDGGGNRANPLFLPATLPKNVYFILTMRNRESIRISASHVEPFTIEHDDPANLNDVRAFISLSLSRPGIRDWMTERQWTEEEFVRQLESKSDGNFMYCRYVLPAIEKGEFSSDKAIDLPHGLREYYRCHWEEMQRRNDREFRRIAQPVVCVLAAAYTPVPLFKIAQWTRLSEAEVREVLEAWQEFTHIHLDADGERLYRLYHISFLEFLQDKVDRGLKTYHRMIVEAEIDRQDEN